MDLRQKLVFQDRLQMGKLAAWGIMAYLALVYGWLQIVRNKDFERTAQQQAMKVRPIPSPRGIISDRNGHRLVDNRRAHHLVIQREDLPNPKTPQIEEILDRLGTELNYPSGELFRLISAYRRSGVHRSLVLRENLDETGLAFSERLRSRYPFLSVEIAPRRVYLGDELAAHVLGYVGEVNPDRLNTEPGKYQLGEIIGITGVEASLNAILKGVDGQKRILVDQLGREVALQGLVDSRSGQSIQLTLDAGLQRTLLEAFGEEKGAGVVIDLKDGGILAMISSPSFDPNLFLNRLSQEMVDRYIRNPIRPMLNRCTQGIYAPGSTFKLLVALAALEKGILTPETRFFCTKVKKYYGREFRCEHAHGSLDLVQAIEHSCNIYFYELGSRLDIDDLYRCAEKYGMTVPTGIDLPHERRPRIPSREWKRRVKKEKWYAGETISVAVGQGAVGVTPLALARFYAILASGGRILHPHLFRKTEGESSTSSPQQESVVPIQPSILRVLEQGLARVVQSGTASNIYTSHLDIVGKTGTSQVTTFVDRTHYAKLKKELKDNALFAGWAPRQNPQIAFAFVVENAGFGARSAAPLARKACQYWLVDRHKKPLPPPGGQLPDRYDDSQSALEDEGAQP